MTVKDVQKTIEAWAPKEIAWERDNVGLQVGSVDLRVRAILVCLDVTERTISEATARNANLIISHHPLLYHPLRSLDSRTPVGRCVSRLVQSRISLYSAHTNLDFAQGGTSFALAERLGLRKADFLLRSHRLKKKIVTFVPPTYVDQVANAMASVGAGRIGNYELCSFRSAGTGTFKGNDLSSPTIGKRGRFEHAEEIRLEMVADAQNVSSVVRAMVDAHPYEEVAYDVYPLENISTEYGMGVIGELSQSMSARRFLEHVRRRLQASGIRFCPTNRKQIHRVAVCGGSGSELTGEAIRQGADSFVTADVRYHGFQDVADRILLIDAGHYETEYPVVNSLVKRLTEEFKKRGVGTPVFATRTSSNPVVYH